MLDLAITNASVVTESGVFDGAVGIEGERIAYVGPAADLPEATRLIDAGGQYLIPGFIDPHVHVRGGKPGPHEAVYAKVFPSETIGAVYGGVTTTGIFSWSLGDDPVTPGIEQMRLVGEQHSYVDFFAHVVVTRPEHVQELESLARDHGCWSFKHFFNANKPRGEHSRASIYPGVENDTLFRSLEVVNQLGDPAIGMIHCEDQDIAWILEDRLRAQGRNDLRAWAEASPGWEEFLRMRIGYDIARAVDAPLYVVHVAAREGVELLREARNAGVRYWGETCPHYLTHTAEMEDQIGCWGKVNTAIKFDADREALWAGLADGSVSNMGTDHCGFTRAYKEGGGGKHQNIWAARAGIVGGLEHWLPVMFTHGLSGGRLDVEQIVRVCSTNNARVFGLYPRKGTIRVGSDADLVIVDPNFETTIDPDFYHSDNGWSIYDGWGIKGMARTTVLRGQVLMHDRRLVAAPGVGRYVIPIAAGRSDS